MARWEERRPVTVIVPCAAEKHEGSHPARELYASSNFRNTLRSAEAMVAEEGGQVLILSALYGLVRPEQVIESYDVKMGEGHPQQVQPWQVAVQMWQHGIAEHELYVLAPADYFAVVDEASRMIGGPPAQDVYEAAPGIGFQRGAVRWVRESYAAAARR